MDHLSAKHAVSSPLCEYFRGDFFSFNPHPALSNCIRFPPLIFLSI